MFAIILDDDDDDGCQNAKKNVELKKRPKENAEK